MSEENKPISWFCEKCGSEQLLNIKSMDQYLVIDKLQRENESLKKLQQELAAEKAKANELLEALEFYQENESGEFDLAMYSEKLTQDCGDTAREAIAKYKGASDG